MLKFLRSAIASEPKRRRIRQSSEDDIVQLHHREKRERAIMQRKDNSSLTKTVGKRLTALRTSKKMSQEEFAKRVGISRGYLSDLERGVREMSLATLAVVCKKSGTTPNKLLGWSA